MRPIAFDKMLVWISEEYKKYRSIFGIPEHCFFHKKNGIVINIFGESCDTPIGPAAGPHTQLAQNIVTAYLVGGRFIELKTVQKLDSLKIDKPCIDARDEGYNTEWSTELSLEQAFDEYVKAWILLHFIERIIKMRKTNARSFIFNMSVGYDLEGIKTPNMDSFINGLADASQHPLFLSHLEELDSFIKNKGGMASVIEHGKGERYANIAGEITPKIIKSVTLSTMHGCPPNEIEAICTYLMKEKKLHTFVKLNPTLLGYVHVRKILDALGFHYIELKESTFSHDLQYDDATKMIERLVEKSVEFGCKFGVKLSNTLGAANTGNILPGDEMYMSGRSLFPLTVTLASRLSQEYNGHLPISFSGGASQLNVPEIFEAGIKPITMVTDLLKVGGYLRMRETANMLEPLLAKNTQNECIDVIKLDRIAKESIKKTIYTKAWRGEKMVAVDEKLPLTDCYIAPCVSACPIHQEIPEYIRLVNDRQYDKALEIIYSENPLPNITGHICDHQCMYNCTRIDYEGPVSIRDIKRIAATRGKKTYRAQGRNNFERLDIKTAVIGAGPAGLAASYFLAKAGFGVTVFEKQRSPGGVVANVLPHFRIPSSAIKKDIKTIGSMGVDFKFGVSERFSIDNLKKEGYKYIFIGIGAEVSGKLQLIGDNQKIFDVLNFLRFFKNNRHVSGLGRRVAVIGGGNTAMDSARAAIRVKGVEEVTIIYRRTEKEMPADVEEFENALRDGISFEPLLSPELFLKEGVLRCRKMRLGDPDASGRRSPVPTEETREMQVDSIISAIGERVDSGILSDAGLKIGADGKCTINKETLETEIPNVYMGGDAYRGPSTVVESIADARKAVASIINKEKPGFEGFKRNEGIHGKSRFMEIYEKKGKLLPLLASGDDTKVSKNEFLRCLECNSVCNKCVDVCPNRANIYLAVNGEFSFRDAWQILHLDAICNECGNCGTFCPYDGLPYKDKLTLFSSKKDFDESSNNGFYVSHTSNHQLVHLRLKGAFLSLKAIDDNEFLRLEPESPEVIVNDEVQKICSIIKAVIKNHDYLLRT